MRNSNKPIKINESIFGSPFLNPATKVGFIFLL